MSEVIEAYIRRHPGASEPEAFEGFLREDRIQAWVGADPSRRERLRREFARVWSTLNNPEGAPGKSGPAGPQSAVLQPRAVRVEVQTSEKAINVHAAGPHARKLELLCPQCTRYDVWLAEGTIACRGCGREYHDMLSLVPVKPVGPLEFMFGEGLAGYATAGGIAAGLVLLYVVFRYL